VQQHDDDEDGRDGEERRRRVGDADHPGQRVEAGAPEREHDHDAGGDEPEQRVALAQAAAADQLEHDRKQAERDERRDEGDLERRHDEILGARKRPTKSASETFAM